MRIIPVVAAVIEHNGKYLVCRRGPEKVDDGLWEFPGGKVEPGETPDEALVREIREELGVEVIIGQAFDTSDTAIGGRIIRLTCFYAELVSEPPTESTDHDRLEWATPDELTRFDWATPDLPAVQHLRGQSVAL